MSDIPSKEGVGEIVHALRQAGADYALSQDFFDTNRTPFESIYVASKIRDGDCRTTARIITELREGEDKPFDAGYLSREYNRFDKVLFEIGAYALGQLEAPEQTVEAS